jgi:hypothetical protein
MSLTSWFQRGNAHRGPLTRNTRRRCRWPRAQRHGYFPRLETLENRSMLTTFWVDNLDDSGPGSLREAVLEANAVAGGDDIRFGVSGTIALASGQMLITDDLTIDGHGRITISGNHMSRVFQIVDADTTDADTIDVEMTRLSIVDGFASGMTPIDAAGGGIQNIGGHLTLSHVTMTGNQAFASVESLASGGMGVATAGAVDSFMGGSLVISHSRFVGNAATGAILSAGGAILSEGSLTIKHSDLTDNWATTLLGSGPSNPLQGAAAGGAISVGSGSDVSVSHSHFAGNVARGGNGFVMPGFADGDGGDGSSGAIFASPVSLIVPPAPVTLSVEHSTFTNNLAIAGDGVSGGAGGEATGGAIDAAALEVLPPGATEPIIFAVTARVAHSKFLNNAVIGGAGGDGADGQAGGAGGLAWGGAYANTGGTLTVEHTAFHGNSAAGGSGGAGGPGANGGSGGVAHGGAVASSNNTLLAPGARPTTSIRHSLFSHNAVQGGAGGAGGTGADGGDGADAFGGALDHQIGTMTLRGSLLISNWATGGRGGSASAGGMGGNGGNGLGGGFSNDLGGRSSISSTLVIGNRAQGGDGAAGDQGGGGGDGQGGGVWNGVDSALEFTRSWIVGNRAKRGAAGAGGSPGTGVGGGIYNLGAIDIDAHTHVFGNYADLFGNCFGC